MATPDSKAPATRGDHPPERWDPWRVTGWWDLAVRVGGTISDATVAKFEHAISVAVKGGPEADIKRAWFLALSIAFGRYANKPTGALNRCSFQGTWDVSGKVASVEIAYTLNDYMSLIRSVKDGAADLGEWAGGTIGDKVAGLVDARVAAKRGVPGGVGAAPTANPYAFFYRGPEQLTVGGPWPDELIQVNNGIDATGEDVEWVGTPQCITSAPRFDTVSWVRFRYRRFGPDVFREAPVLSGRVTGDGALMANAYPYSAAIPFDQADGAVPKGRTAAFVAIDTRGRFVLPDTGRVILTAEKNDPRVQPPAPPLDGHTRSDYLALVASALTDPCFLPTTPPCNTARTGTGGYSVLTPFLGTRNSTAAFNAIYAGVARRRSVVQVNDWANPNPDRDGYPGIPVRAPNFTHRPPRVPGF